MDRNLENIVNRVANRNSISPARAKLATEIFFKNAKLLMQRQDMPTIMIHNFGRFEPDERRIKRRMSLLKKQLIDKKITEEEYKESLAKFSNIITRLNEEKHTRNNNLKTNNNE